jgi:hypothetical protein
MSQRDPAPVRSFTAVVPLRHDLPPELALMLAPIRTDEPSAPDRYAGRAEGVLLDHEGRVVAFIVRLATKLNGNVERTLVPTTIATLEEGPTLHLAWTNGQLRAHPRLDEDLKRPDPVHEEAPGEAPPGGGVSGSETAKEGVEGGLLGAALGALAGLVLGGPIAAASMAVFFATGGSVLGMVAGASEEKTPPEATTTTVNPVRAHDAALAAALELLEARLRRDPELEGVVITTRIVPPVTGEPAEQAAA